VREIGLSRRKIARMAERLMPRISVVVIVRG
jgi:hypothetical protein